MNRTATTGTNSVMSILDRPLGRMNIGGSSGGGSGPRSIIGVGNNTTYASSSSDTQNSTTVVSLSMFAYLFSEMVQYYQNRVDSISELERRLESSGYTVGLRVLELLAIRGASNSNVGGRGGYNITNNEYRRETKLMNILQFISTTVWKSLFHKAADSLERSIDHADEFMIVDYAPITSTFVSIPADFGGLSVDSYLSGIIAGILHGAGFPSRVTAHTVTLDETEAAAAVAASNSAAVAAAAAAAVMNPMSSSSNNNAVAAFAASSIYIPGLPPRKEKTVFLVKFAASVLARDSQLNY